jgi:hypothetical protein
LRVRGLQRPEPVRTERNPVIRDVAAFVRRSAVMKVISSGRAAFVV